MLWAGMALAEKNGLSREVVSRLWSTMAGGKIPAGGSLQEPALGRRGSSEAHCLSGRFPVVVTVKLGPQ